ncbi:MAG TPA: LysR family transcriptional regulator [Xanthobacteraceae bacterium]
MQWSDRIGRRIKLRDMHILLAVAKFGSMGKAAAELAMSQPAVSKAISDLEHALGLRLLDRSPQGVEPTPYGDALMRCGTAVFDDLKQGVKELQFLADPTVGELSIGCTEPSAAGFVAVVIDRFSRENPKAVFDVVTADFTALHTRELPERKIDLAFIPMTETPSEHDTVSEWLLDDRHVVAAAVDSKWTRRRHLTLAQLADEPWVLPQRQSAVGSYISEGFRAAGLDLPDASVHTFSLALHQRLLATGRYLTALPLSMLDYNRHLSLRQVAVEFPVRPRPIWIMTLRNRTLSPLAQRFIECARRVAKSPAKIR